MFNLNKSQPGFVPAKYIEMVLEFTELEPGRTVSIKDRSNGRSWRSSYIHALMFLVSSYKDYEANVRMLDIGEAKKGDIFQFSKTRVFAGFFAYDQLILQTFGLPYEVYEDQSARVPQNVNGQIFYFGLASEKDWPIVKPEVAREGDATLNYEPDMKPD
jgi:hypothetical protein